MRFDINHNEFPLLIITGLSRDDPLYDGSANDAGNARGFYPPSGTPANE